MEAPPEISESPPRDEPAQLYPLDKLKQMKAQLEVDLELIDLTIKAIEEDNNAERTVAFLMKALKLI